jgi:hypothetical protein
MALDINGRIGVALLSWFVMAAVVSFVIGKERKHRWFKLRDPSKSFLNRRGFLGDFINFGYPRTLEGLSILLGITAFILVTGYVAVYYDQM